MIQQGRMLGKRQVVVIMLLLLIAGTARAQIYEVGVQGGISAYKGDLNLDKYFNKIYPAVGLMLRYNHNQHVSARLNGTYTILRGSDLRSSQPYIIMPPDTLVISHPIATPFSQDTILIPGRHYAFETKLFELSLQAEINFLPFTVGSEETRFTPYLFGGIGGIYYNPTGYKNANSAAPSEITDDDATLGAHWYNKEERDDFSNFSVISLFGFGFRFNLSEDFVAGVEWGMRYAGLPGNNQRGTDYLDMVSLKGNPKNNDWYSIVAVSFTYKFLDRSQPPCPFYNY